MKPNWLSHVQVSAQLAGIALSCYPVGLVNHGAPWWLALCVAGTTFGLWALFHNRIGNFRIYPEPHPGAELITTGPYRLVRHPMYTALIVMMLGVALYNGHLVNAAGLILVTVAVAGKAIREERFLGDHFRNYREYAAATPRFIPYLY
jgi:protein-S-isoprenylcysteine O-methyltransferase Ste14